MGGYQQSRPSEQAVIGGGRKKGFPLDAEMDRRIAELVQREREKQRNTTSRQQAAPVRSASW